ncbi:MAG: amidohydrolase family protein [Cytophagales bacterium]|nr:amidohydrolase family protein [Cytophagales bacterium]
MFIKIQFFFGETSTSPLMGVDKDFGTVSEGKYADIIAVKGDVLRHMALLQDVKMVVKKGKRYK